jgi:serine/threonine-protein kinase
LSPLPNTRHSLLLRLGRREDEAAWREFLAVYEAGVYRHARRRGLQDSDARDVVQQVLVAVYAKAAVWQPGPQVGAFRAWLMRTTHNITVDCLRTRLRGGVQDAEPVDEAAARSEPAAAMSADDNAARRDWERWAFAWAADIVRGEVAELTWEAFRRSRRRTASGGGRHDVGAADRQRVHRQMPRDGPGEGIGGATVEGRTMKLLRCEPRWIDSFVAGRLDAGTQATFEAHLGTCETCRQRLEQAVGSDDDWTAAREFLSGPDVAEGIMESTTRGMVPPWSTQITTYLAPTEDPAFLGRVGHYEIAGVIGRGGAGIVLKGFDRSLHRNVAIKLLAPEFATIGAAHERFFREAKAMASVAHENLVAIFEVDEHRGLPYFVMEYLPGGTLGRRLRDAGPMDVVTVLRIGVQIAEALAVAHAQGLVHRDIKPDNILLDRGTERVRVADFGLVRVMGEVTASHSSGVVGTPQFMAPEQCRGESCDARSDLFSLGAVLYALCTGHSPFRADTVFGVMQRVLNDTPRSIREQSPRIPDWLEELVFKLLRKDPKERFPAAAEVAAMLREELAFAQAPLTSPQPSRSWRPARHGRRWIGVSLAAGLLLAGGSAMVWRNQSPTPVVSTVAESTIVRPQTPEMVTTSQAVARAPLSPDQATKPAAAAAIPLPAEPRGQPLDARLDELAARIRQYKASLFEPPTSPPPDDQDLQWLRAELEAFGRVTDQPWPSPPLTSPTP